MPDDEINLLDELDIGDEETDFGRGYARGVAEGRRRALDHLGIDPSLCLNRSTPLLTGAGVAFCHLSTGHDGDRHDDGSGTSWMGGTPDE